MPLSQQVIAPTQFEQLTQRLGVTDLEGMKANQTIRQWVRAHYRMRYVPEDLLDELGLKLDWGSIEL